MQEAQKAQKEAALTAFFIRRDIPEDLQARAPSLPAPAPAPAPVPGLDLGATRRRRGRAAVAPVA